MLRIVLGGSSISRKLTDFEKKVCNFVKAYDGMIVSNVPKNMSGEIPNLKNAGLVKIFRKSMTGWSSKKKTFVKAIEQ
jgi:hypothetical protein